MEAKYHLTCLVKLRNRYRSLNRKQSQKAENTNEKMNESLAFVELSSYIEISVNSGTLLFKLSEIHSLRHLSRVGRCSTYPDLCSAIILCLLCILNSLMWWWFRASEWQRSLSWVYGLTIHPE